MQREEMTRVRRELGMDLVEAGRKAGVSGPTQPLRREPPRAEDCTLDEINDHYVVDFDSFDIWTYTA